MAPDSKSRTKSTLGSRAFRETVIFRLDKESRKLILDNLRAQLQASGARMIAELRFLTTQLQRCPTLLEFLSETGHDLADVYKPSIGGWHALLAETELLTERLSATALSSSAWRRPAMNT